MDHRNALRYASCVIRSFADAATATVFAGKRARSLPPEMQQTAFRKLVLLEAAADLAALRLPSGNRLEALQGSRAGLYSIRINNQWRLCFRWRDGDAFDVEILDYH